MLLPAKELLSIETINEIKKNQLKDTVTTIIVKNNLEVPVYTVDDEFRFSSYQEGNMSCCLCLDNGKNRFGIVCDEASLIDSSDFTQYDLPGCMKSAMGLIHHLTVSNDTVYCNTDTARLFRLID